MRQSQNPKEGSKQTFEKTTEVFVPAPVGAPVTNQVVLTRTTEKVNTEIGAAQKDTAREIGAKLASLSGVMWVGVVLFLFGAASAVYPPLKLIVGSVTTSAVLAASGLALIVLPSLIVGHEILILAVAGGAAGLYFFAHRHGSTAGALASAKTQIETLLKK